MVFIFCVEGNIAAGKSTLLQEIVTLDPRIVVIPERVATWQGRETGTNLLQEFYADPDSKAFPFQLMVLHTRVHDIVQAIMSPPENTILLVERSLESDRIFAKQNRDLGRISDLEWSVYELMVKENSKLFDVTGRVLLRVPVDTLKRRIASRGRSEEVSISDEYILSLDAAHAETFGDGKIHMVDNQDINVAANDVLSWIHEIVAKLQSIPGGSQQ